MTTRKLPPPVEVRGGAGTHTVAPFAATLRETPPSWCLESGARAVSPVVPQTVAPPPAPRAPEPAPSAPAPERAVASQPARRHDTALFRYEALRAYRLGHRLSTPLRIVPLSTRVILSTLGAVLLGVVAIAGFGHVDLTARGRGVLRASEGVQPLMFEIDGVVREVLVHDGDVVQGGQVLVRLDSTRLSAALSEAEELLLTVDERTRKDDAQAQDSYTRDRALLERRRRLTRARIESQTRSLRALDRDRARYMALNRDGLVPDKTMRESEELLQHEQRNLLTLEDEQARIEQQSTVLEQTYRAGLTQRAQALRDARSRRDAASLLLRQTDLRAARPGRVESLVVGAGDVITASRAVAKLVPLVTGRRVTAFVPEHERAFVQPSALVRLELDQLPVGEFGSAAARVVRVSSEVASTPEIERTLGAAAPEGVHFAIVLELVDTPATHALVGRVGSGTLLTVRLPVRRRRILALLFDPVRKWLD